MGQVLGKEMGEVLHPMHKAGCVSSCSEKAMEPPSLRSASL